MSLIAAKELKVEEKISKEDWFIDMICNTLLGILDVDDNRQLFKTLLKNNLIVPLIGTYRDNGILLHYKEMIIKDIITEFEIELGLEKSSLNLNESDKVESDKSPQKRNIYNLIKRIQKYFVKIEDIKSDGTFETLYEKNTKDCDTPCGSMTQTTSEF